MTGLSEETDGKLLLRSEKKTGLPLESNHIQDIESKTIERNYILFIFRNAAAPSFFMII